MFTLRQLTALFAGTTSVILIQWLPLIDSSLNFLSQGSATHLRLTPSASADILMAADSGFDPDVDNSPTQGTLGTGARLRYVPPDDLDAPRGTRGSGSRGCEQSLESSTPTLLVPVNHVGLTISGRPTFFWYLSNIPSVPVKFKLVEPGVPEAIYEQQIENPQVGMNQLRIPQNLPELVPGHQYRWTVSLICNPNKPSKNVLAQAWMKRIPESPALKQEVAAAKSDFARAQVYANSSLWYDTLAAMSAARTANPNDQQLLKDLLSLLDQVGLSQTTKQELERTIKQQSLGVVN